MRRLRLLLYGRTIDWREWLVLGFAALDPAALLALRLEDPGRCSPDVVRPDYRPLPSETGSRVRRLPAARSRRERPAGFPDA